MGEKRAQSGLGGWLLCGLLLGFGAALAGCDRGGDGGGGSQAQVDAGAQPPAIGRPADATAGPRVGVVVTATPDVRVVPSQGAPFPAAEGTMLVRDDRLSTGSGADSFVVVELYNGHVVRFNQGTSIVVAGISVFDAPPAGDDLAARFERVLRPEEQGDERLRGAISRVAGWNSRMTATETIAPLQAPPTPRPEELKSGGMPKDDRDDGPGDAPEAKPEAPLRDAPADLDLDEKKKASTKKNEKPGNLGKQSESPPPPPGHPPSQGPRPPEPDGGVESTTKKKEGPETPKPETTALDLADQVKFKPESGAEQTVKLPAALAISRKALAKCAGAGATLKVRIKGGVIVAIQVEGGKGATCTEGKHRGVKLADGTLEVRVSP